MQAGGQVVVMKDHVYGTFTNIGPHPAMSALTPRASVSRFREKALYVQVYTVCLQLLSAHAQSQSRCENEKKTSHSFYSKH